MSEIAQRLAGLSPEKRRLLELRLRVSRGDPAAGPVAPRPELGDTAPLSFAQEQLWLAEQLGAGTGVYNMPHALRLRGPLDVEALRGALSEVVRRHEPLRSVFPDGGSGPVQRVLPPAPVPLPVAALEGTAEEREAEMLRLARVDAALPFDLRGGPPLRAALLRLDAEEHVLLLTLHHAVSDGWSMGVLFRELCTLYDALSAGSEAKLPPLPIRYADYASWQREQLDGAGMDRGLAFWREALEGAPPLLELPTDRPRPPTQSFRGARQAIDLPAGLAERLRTLARGEDATLFMALLAAWQLLLARWSGQDDLVVGAPIANRHRVETEGLVGFFVNTLALRGRLDGDPSFRELLRRVRRATVDAYAHQDVPLEAVLEALEVARDPGRNPLFQAAFVLQNAPAGRLRMRGLEVDLLEGEGGTAKFDLLLEALESPEGVGGWIEYAADLFDAATAARMAGQLRTLLEAVAADPDARISALPLLTAGERRELVERWARSGAEEDTAACVHHLFEAQARRVPGAVAVEMGGRALTYAELDRRAGAIARALRARGVGPDARVGICLPRSPELVVGVLGALKAGGAYIPLDPGYPAERLAWMLHDSGARVLLTEVALAERFAGSGVEVVLVGAEETPFPPAHSPPVGEWEDGTVVTPEHLAFVVYTSGSTGEPKGTGVPHRAVPGFFRGADYVRFGEEEVLLQHSSTSWDAFALELWPALLTGGRCVLYDGATPEPPRLAETIRRHGVTTLWLPSAFFNVVVDGAPELLASVRQVMVGGEAVSAAHARRALELYPRLRLVNGYGPSECTVFSTCWPIPRGWDGATVPIGRPVGDRRVYVLDRAGEPAPPGVPGELHVGGPGVARGYLGRPALTAERFVPDPFGGEPGARLYRTGDVVRWRPDATLEFVRRTDDQVKVRGFRVEPGEIEAALLRHPAVREAVVVAREDAAGAKRLVAYVVPDGGLRAPELLDWVRAELPEYMVPSAVVALDALPLTRNGKLDRGALPAPEWEGGAARVAPRTPDEEILAGIWAEVLGAERVGAHDDFFALGGHSLSATRVVSRAGRVLGAEVPLRALFEAPTLAAFAERVRALRGEEAAPAAPPLVPVAREAGERLPLSFAQERLWLLEQLRPGGSTYAIAARVRLAGALDAEALRRALEELVRRHEALRTVFSAADGRPAQTVLPAAPLALEAEDLAALSPDRRAAEAAGRMREEALRPFDLERGPLFRLRLLRLAADEHLLFVGMHHVVSDAWSMGVLFDELAALYGAFSRGEPSPLPELPVQYPDYAVWQRAWLAGEVLDAQLGWWRERLAGAPRALELPTDRPRPAVQSGRGALHRFAFPAELAAGVRALGRREGTTPFMTLLAGFGALLAKYSGQDDLLLGTPVAGRTRPETEGLIGFFVNTLALRARLDGEPTFRDLLGRTREATLGAFAHQELPFERLVEELEPERDLGRSPLVQVVFSLLSGEGAAPGLPGLRMEVEEEETHTAKFDLTLALEERPDGISGALEYATDLFDAATVERLAAHLAVLLAGALADPDARVAGLTLLDEGERRVLGEWSGAPLPPTEAWVPVHERVLARAAEAPGSVAVVCGGARLTYGELERRSGELAAELRRRGAGPETRVALRMERSPDLVVAMLAVLRAGAAYLPIDPATPAARVEGILEDSGAALVVTEAGVAPSPAPAPRDSPAGEAAPESAAYVIYTSGSTGTPKGVVVTHRGLANLVDWHLGAFGVTAADRATQVAGLGFDASVWETWPYLAAGAELHLVADEETRASPAAMRDFLLAREATLAFVPTPLAEGMLALEWPRACALRALLTGGDALRVRPAADAPFALVNAYGPTENTVVATAGVVPAGGERAPGIGRPIRGVRAYVLDGGLRPVPAGVPGELCLGGASVAREYAGRPEATAAAFVPDPSPGEPGARMYRTGDRVRWLPGGELEFLGRIDRQVKVRGFRIEPGEVEAALLAHPAVRGAAVVVRTEAPGDTRLVGYVVAADGELPEEELRTHLRQRLPEYMVPSALVALEALPLTPSGKTDRAALPAPERPADAYTAPRTQVEEVLAAVWGALLGRERVGTREGFFALGGHSLLATQVISRVRQLFGVDLPLRALFEAPTVERLAARIEAARGEGEGAGAPPLRPTARTEPVPASFAQERLWFLEQMRPGEATYAIPAALRMAGPLDAEALRRSLEEVVRRHEALRTVFERRNGRPVQAVRPAGTLDLAVEELPAGDAEARDAALRARMAEEAHRLFDLERGPLFRVALLRLGEDDHALLLSMHLIVSDGWSMGVLLRELSVLYAAHRAGEPAALPPLPVQYADFAAWQREWLRGDALEGQVAFWRERLAGAPARLEIPTDHPRPAVQGSRGAVLSFRIPGEAADAARALARREGVTLFMALVSAWELLLARHSGADDLVVGVPTAGRTRRELEELIGFFVNALPLRADLGGDPSTRELLARAREGVLGAYAHQDVPFEKLVEELRVERSLAHSPIFQVMFTLMDAPLRVPELPGLAVRALEGQTGTAKFDLTLGVMNADDALEAELEYATDLFDRATAERLADRYRLLLDAMTADPARPVSEIPLLTAGEREQVLRGWAGARARHAADRPVHHLLADRAARRPDAVAVVDGEVVLTRAELVGRAGRLAAWLLRRGVGPETRVAVCMERGWEALAAQLGVLMAGGAYVPLDPAYPAERIAYVAADSGAALLLTQARLRGRLPELAVETVALDEAWPSVEAEPGGGGRAADVSPENLAYVIYTSGSTGRPKGVGVTHGGLLNLVGWHARVFGDGEGDRATQLAGPGFDATVWETWPYLAAGVELHVVPEEVRAAPEALRGWLLERRITSAFLPTPLAEAALALEWPADAPLRTLHTGGDALRIRPRPGLPFALVNDYGPTECTVIAASGTVAPGDGSASVPGIGRPVDNTAAYVLDGALQPVPPGVPGELYLGGELLARGYLGRPDLTAEKWLPDPHSAVPGARMYRTSDRVRWLADGELEFMERTDRQVKVRGFRIETGEVEAVLCEHPSVREAVVEARGDARERRLVGYVVAAAGASADAAELRTHLAARLPDYMVPSAWVFLEALPVTPNGKTDRAALPEPRREADASAEPRNALEDAVAAAWREALALERVGIHDNFFELGGHSLLLAQVHARLRETLGRDIPILDLFRFPTVAALAEHLGAGEAPAAAPGQGRGSERAAARRALARGRGRGGS
ncbi:MAG TPA: amino acid adenylation domain-containing protein [Longimicrobiaceae bacterium]|nr:amino acid adenylation domain-containing protein [Longimicrobiaceae bacterium]